MAYLLIESNFILWSFEVFFYFVIIFLIKFTEYQYGDFAYKIHYVDLLAHWSIKNILLLRYQLHKWNNCSQYLLLLASFGVSTAKFIYILQANKNNNTSLQIDLPRLDNIITLIVIDNYVNWKLNSWNLNTRS